MTIGPERWTVGGSTLTCCHASWRLWKLAVGEKGFPPTVALMRGECEWRTCLRAAGGVSTALEIDPYLSFQLFAVK